MTQVMANKLTGWCLTGFHENCPVEITSVLDKDLITTRVCECPCHSQREEKVMESTQQNEAQVDQKTHYESEHAYLIEKGLAKPGKGRRSAAGHEAIQRAIESGITFGKK